MIPCRGFLNNTIISTRHKTCTLVKHHKSCSISWAGRTSQYKWTPLSKMMKIHTPTNWSKSETSKHCLKIKNRKLTKLRRKHFNTEQWSQCTSHQFLKLKKLIGPYTNNSKNRNKCPILILSRNNQYDPKSIKGLKIWKIQPNS